MIVTTATWTSNAQIGLTPSNYTALSVWSQPWLNCVASKVAELLPICCGDTAKYHNHNNLQYNNKIFCPVNNKLSPLFALQASCRLLQLLALSKEITLCCMGEPYEGITTQRTDPFSTPDEFGSHIMPQSWTFRGFFFSKTKPFRITNTTLKVQNKTLWISAKNFCLASYIQ